MREFEIETPRGPARAHLESVRDARGALLLGHGAGGGVTARDLQTASATALGQGFSVVLVEQPYRVAGRRSVAPARQLDAAWLAVTERLCGRELAGLPLIFGGRSSGARVACRTAGDGGAIAVLCLAFPLLPPRRASSAKAPESRLPELDAVTVPVLVVQGRGDRFGMPPPSPSRTVVEVAGDHSLRTDLAAVGAAIASWLSELDVPVAVSGGAEGPRSPRALT
jgi:predicted alpha/beta-hydrolase family hydrolase